MATVTISVPELSSAAFIASDDSYLPVPRKRRELKARPAISSGWSSVSEPPATARTTSTWSPSRNATAVQRARGTTSPFTATATRSSGMPRTSRNVRTSGAASSRSHGCWLTIRRMRFLLGKWVLWAERRGLQGLAQLGGGHRWLGSGQDGGNEGDAGTAGG